MPTSNQRTATVGNRQNATEESPGTKFSRNLEHGWEEYKLRGRLAWHEIKDAVRDSWNHATGNR